MVRRSEWETPTGVTERFGGIIESATPANAGEYDAVLLGEPYDDTTTGRAGAQDGPVAIRDALASVETHHLDAGPVESLGDVGTVEIPADASVASAREAVREAVSALHEADTVPIILGGSSSLTYANIVGLLEATAATDGGRPTDEYVTDGGFGEDEESVGDVEHFDPSATDEDTETSDGDETDTDADEDSEDDGETTDEDDTVEGGANEADDQTAVGEEDDESEDDEGEADEDEAEQTDATEEDDESEDDEGETDEKDADESAGDNENEADEDEADDSEEADTEGTDEATTADDAEGAVDDTAFAMPEEDEETAVIEDTDATGRVETVGESAANPDGDSTTETDHVGVVSLDARLDCRADGEPTNRNGYRQLFEAGLDSLAVLGARHFESSTAEAEFLRDRDGTVVTAEEVADDPVEATDRALGAMDAVDQFYVSIDLSVLDPAAAPGVSDPAPGGLSTRELFRVVRLLAADDRIAGIELVEAVPTLDQDDRTVDAAARVVAHAVASISQ